MANNQSPNLMAGGSILPSTFVKMDTSNLAGAAQGNIGIQATANSRTIGISMEGTDQSPLSSNNSTQYAAVSGESFKMYGLGDICLLQCSGGWTSGDELEATTNGLGLTAPNTGAAENIGAIALTNCNDTEFGLVQVVMYQRAPGGGTTFSTITMSDGGNITVGASSGTEIATNASQKLGFFGATPVVQQISTVDLRQALINLGFVATGGANPLNLNGGALTAAAGTFTGAVALNAASNLNAGLTIAEAANLTLGTSTGTQIGTAANQKLAFFGATAIIKPASTGELIGYNGNGATNANAVNFNSNGNNGSTSYGLGDIVKHLKELGLLTA